ncbi:hypothetical protein [Paenibacillus sp. 1P03SA]|uniref:hypothetical protein n=1 Tax=Paenibacillus sp. 1P03SA TaxID=3132294 RepID=UPI00399FD8C4
MKEMTSKFIIATAILAAPAAGTALEASAQTVAVQSQTAVQPAVEGVQAVQAVQAAPSGTLTQTGAVQSREALLEFGGGNNFVSPAVLKKTPL